MIKKLTVAIAMTIILSLLAVSCTAPTLTPATTPELPIPANYSTYTSEGLFSISYPLDWVPATSIMEEVFEWAKESMKSTDPELQLEETKILFFGGIPIEEGYYPAVNIIIAPRSVAYWTLDEIVEVETLWAMENTPGYREHSQIRTVVDGREAVIIDSEDNDPDFGRWRYLQLYMVKEKFMWVVTVSSEYPDFRGSEDTFESIVRSLRILN